MCRVHGAASCLLQAGMVYISEGKARHDQHKRLQGGDVALGRGCHGGQEAGRDRRLGHDSSEIYSNVSTALLQLGMISASVL